MKLDAAALTAGMERALLKRSESGPTANKPVEERKVPRASGLAQGCARQVFYWLTGAPSVEREPHSAAATQMGQDLEQGVLADFCDAIGMPGADIFGIIKGEEQVRVETEWYTGSADLVVTHRDGSKAVVDSKTANCDSFEIKKREGMSPEHKTQLSLYAHALGAETIVVVLRNTDPRAKRGKPSAGVYHVQIAPRDDAAVEKAKAVATQAMEARQYGDESHAPRAYTQTDWQCRYCDFREHCWRKP